MALSFEFQAPEATTVLRWVLRTILVLFLAWLVKRKPDEDEAEEESNEQAYRGAQSAYQQRGGRNSMARGGQARYQQQSLPHQKRDPYANGMRERRNTPNSSFDFDTVIDKMSKPKEMWEVRKDGSVGTGPTAFRRNTPSDAARSPAASGGLNGSMESTGSQREAGHRKSLSTGGVTKQSSREAREKEAGKTLHGHERPVTFITWSEDCSLLFSCGKDKIVCVWSFPDGEQLGAYKGHSGAVWACSVTADARWLVTSGADQRAIVWEARTSRELARVELPGVVRFVEWATSSTPSADADGPATERFVTCHNRFGSHPAALTVWQFDGTNIEEQLRISTLPTPANQVKWGRNNEVLASAHENGELIFWRADTGEEVHRVQAHSAAISKFDFNRDREVVATASLDKQVRVWDLGNGSDIEGKLIYESKTDRPLNAVALGPSIQRGTAVGPAGKRPAGVSVIAAGGQDVRDVAKSSSDSEQFGTLLFSLGRASDDIPGDLKAEGVTKGHFGPVHTLAFARHGGAIASGSEDGCVRLHILDGSPDSTTVSANGASNGEA